MMKKILSLLVIVFAVSAITSAQISVPATPAETKEIIDATQPQITFEAELVDYGTIEQGSDPYRYFKFTNTGSIPLLITGKKGSCGCTVPSIYHDSDEAANESVPFEPGESGTLKVRYDTNRVGPFTKRVTLTILDMTTKKVLTIKGKVEKKAEEPAGVPANASGMFNNN